MYHLLNTRTRTSSFSVQCLLSLFSSTSETWLQVCKHQLRESQVTVAVTFMKYYNMTEKSTEQKKQNRSSCISWLLISSLFLFFRWLPPSFCVSHQHDIILLLPNYLPLQLSHDLLAWLYNVGLTLIYFWAAYFFLSGFIFIVLYTNYSERAYQAYFLLTKTLNILVLQRLTGDFTLY